MSETSVKREFGRGERILPGLWRLRLPLPWPGVPHCNAWAIAHGDGIVLVDCGLHQDDSLAQLERALDQAGFRLEQVRQLVITHAHTDHWGQAATVVERTGAPLWMHPNTAHARSPVEDPEASLASKLEIGRQSGVSERALERYEGLLRTLPSGISGLIEPDGLLLDGVVIESDLGPWHVYETPGHAPSHVCLFQPERRLLISGDHVLGRISLYFDHGWTPDPIGEFLGSLDVVDALDARLCMSGHGRTFPDVHAHIEGTRELVGERLAAGVATLRAKPLTAIEAVPGIYGETFGSVMAAWRLSETLCYLEHLERSGAVRRLTTDGVDRWVATDAQP